MQFPGKVSEFRSIFMSFSPVHESRLGEFADASETIPGYGFVRRSNLRSVTVPGNGLWVSDPVSRGRRCDRAGGLRLETDRDCHRRDAV